MRAMLLAIGLAVAAPALAQDNPVKAGVDAWQAGDYATAVRKWRPSADAGDADAQFNLGQAYKLGRGVSVDLAQAEIWYRKAALQGHPQAEDNYGLTLFQNGRRGDAVQWLKRSAARGEPRAQFILGTMFYNADAVEKDWVRAYALMVRSSQSGLAQASGALAQMDKFIPLAERQQGLALARKYEEEASRPLLPPVSIAAAPIPSPRTPRPAAKPTPTRPPAAAANPAAGPWRVQLGAFGDPGNARKLWAQLGSRFPGRQVYYIASGRLTKVLVGPFPTRAAAAASCGAIRPCVAVTN